MHEKDIPRITAPGRAPAGEPGSPWLRPAMHAAFFLLLAASVSRYLARHGTGEPGAALILSLTVGLALGYAAGVLAWRPLGRGRPWWLAAVIAAWVALEIIAPSYAWCAVPLGFLCLEVLPERVVPAAAGVLTAAVIAGEVRIADPVEPSLFLGPLAIAAMTVAVVLELRRRGRALAAARHEAGVLAERERLAREIHDTLAQSLSSIHMLLTAADRAWPAAAAAQDAADAPARRHVRLAAAAAGEGLDEARRFVRELAPPTLDSGTLPEALERLARRTAEETGLDVRVRVEGGPRPLPAAAEAALLRTAQGALANVREHAEARSAVLVLGFGARAVTLGVRDDGRGFDPGAAPSAAGRGYGLPGLRARLAGAGGTLSVESAPGGGTALAARIPLSPDPGPGPGANTGTDTPEEHGL